MPLALHSHFDADRNGKVVFDEFLRGVRGSMCPRRRKLVLKVFDLMDADRNGILGQRAPRGERF